MMCASPLPKLISKLKKEDLSDKNIEQNFIDRNKIRDKRFSSYLGAVAISVSLLGLLVYIGSLTDEAANSLALQLEHVPLLDLKLSKELVNQLKLPNSITNSVFLASLVYAALAVRDLILPPKASPFAHPSDEDHFRESSATSFTAHLLMMILIILVVLISSKPKPQVKFTSIEFIPTQIPSKKAPPPETKRRAEKQSIDQGKQDTKKPLSPATQAPGKPKLPSTPAKPVEQAAPKTVQTPSPKAPTPSPKAAAPAAQQTEPPPKPQPKPIASNKEALEAASTPLRVLPKPVLYSPNTSDLPNLSSNSQGTPSPKSNSGESAERSSSLVSRLSNIPKMPSSNAGGEGGAFGAPGNPGANPYSNRPPSLAAKADVNFGPYMSTLQRKIKLAWKPPRGTESNRIVVVFSIDKFGNLSNLQMSKGCSYPEANEAALNAVRRAAPFDPLPPGSDEAVEIEFTFDYNVFQKSRW
jgi:TonB family protein